MPLVLAVASTMLLLFTLQHDAILHGSMIIVFLSLAFKYSSIWILYYFQSQNPCSLLCLGCLHDLAWTFLKTAKAVMYHSWIWGNSVVVDLGNNIGWLLCWSNFHLFHDSKQYLKIPLPPVFCLTYMMEVFSKHKRFSVISGGLELNPGKCFPCQMSKMEKGMCCFSNSIA